MDLQILDGKIQLSSNLVSMLNAVAGDRIVIGYITNGNEVQPTIMTGEEGNKLSKSNTVIFRGKQAKTLSQFGTNFTAQLIDNNVILLGDGNLKAFTSTEAAVEYTLDKETILDTNYTIKLNNLYEL